MQLIPITEITSLSFLERLSKYQVDSTYYYCSCFAMSFATFNDYKIRFFFSFCSMHLLSLLRYVIFCQSQQVKCSNLYIVSYSNLHFFFRQLLYNVTTLTSFKTKASKLEYFLHHFQNKSAHTKQNCSEHDKTVNNEMIIT